METHFLSGYIDAEIFFRFNIIKIPTKSHNKNDSTFDKSKNIVFF